MGISQYKHIIWLYLVQGFPKEESLKLTAQVNPGTANLDFTNHLLTLKFHFLSFKSIFVQAIMALFS